MEDFWALYNHIELASRLAAGCDYSLFKVTIPLLFNVTFFIPLILKVTFFIPLIFMVTISSSGKNTNNECLLFNP